MTAREPRPPPPPPRPSRRRWLSALLAAPAGVLPLSAHAAAAASDAPLFDGMGDYRTPDASPVARARRYVAQGLVLSWGFNPAEAARSFAGALQHDSRCAAAAWGLAWCLGPTINQDMARADEARVLEALRLARTLRPHASPRWRSLIDALWTRHAAGPGRPLAEEDYEQAMQHALRRHPQDADVATLAAEALMNLHPYDWWEPVGRPLPWTGTIVRRLQAALAASPDHPGANHLWVHLMETSRTPQLALREAARLERLVPGSGHLLHMPAHIYMRVGRYADATAANLRSIEADRRYLAQVDAQRAYRVGYVAHNHHFLWASASMQGRRALALQAAGEAYAAACGPDGRDDGSGIVQHFQVLPLYARVRFGLWNEILTRTAPPDGARPYPLVVWHYARGTAALRLRRIGEARASLSALDAAAAELSLEDVRIKQVNAAGALARIARLTLAADLAAAEGRVAEGLAGLREAVQIEDGLQVDEPHLWLAPTRHALGDALLAARRWGEAERVLREDLAHYPDNGWSLAGLERAQRAQGRAAEAVATARRLRAALRDADVPLTGPRLG